MNVPIWVIAIGLILVLVAIAMARRIDREINGCPRCHHRLGEWTSSDNQVWYRECPECKFKREGEE